MIGKLFFSFFYLVTIFPSKNSWGWSINELFYFLLQAFAQILLSSLPYSLSASRGSILSWLTIVPLHYLPPIIKSIWEKSINLAWRCGENYIFYVPSIAIRHTVAHWWELSANLTSWASLEFFYLGYILFVYFY